MGFSSNQGRTIRGRVPTRFGDTTSTAPDATLLQVAALYAFYFGVQTLIDNLAGVVSYANQVKAGQLTLSAVELTFALYYVTKVLPGDADHINTVVDVPDAIEGRMATLYQTITGDVRSTIPQWIATVKTNFTNQALSYARNLGSDWVGGLASHPVQPMPPLAITADVAAAVAAVGSSSSTNGAAPGDTNWPLILGGVAALGVGFVAYKHATS